VTRIAGTEGSRAKEGALNPEGHGFAGRRNPSIKLESKDKAKAYKHDSATDELDQQKILHTKIKKTVK